MPMIAAFKLHRPKDKPELCCVFDLRESNQNTQKLTASLPAIEDVLRHVTGKKYVSTMDLQACYKQIRVIPEHVRHNLVTTPSGNMQSNIMLQGDCNAPATCQAQMNHMFGPYIGVFLDVYLDDIIVYSDTLEEHLEHSKLVFEILEKERFYLSKKKCHFLPPEVTILGHVVDRDGIRMNSEKVDDILKWKTPTLKEMLSAFIGSVGFLADDIASVRVPLGILSVLMGSTSMFQWSANHQRVFEEVK